jgi:PAS domain S-box-containing protein
VLLSRDNGRPARGRVLVAVLLASVVLLLGAITLSEYVFGWDIGIDRIFAREVVSLGQPFPGRPSPQTSLNLALFGAALLSFNLGIAKFSVGQGGALVTAANAAVAATGYIFSTRVFYGFPTYAPAIGMAVHTATAFVILVVALLAGRPHDGVMSLVTSSTNSARMARRILAAGLVAPPLVGVATRLGVVAGWYDVSVQVSLFALVMVGLILRATWRSARRLEQEELQGRRMFEALERVNTELTRAIDERQMFVALIENSSDFIGIADASGTPVYVNPAGRRMVGLAPDFPVDRTQIPEYYPPDQRAFASDVIVKSMIERGQWEGETTFRHWQTQKAIPVSDTHFMIRSPITNKVLGMGTITRDISEHKRLDEELRLAEARSSGLISISADAIISIDEAQRITLFNEGAEKIFGYSSAEAVGAPLDMLIPERFRRLHRRHVEQFIAGASTARRVGERGAGIFGLRRNGEEFPADASISKLDVDGRRILTVALRDVTEQKRLQSEIQFIADVASELSGTIEYDEILTCIARLAVHNLADFCVIDIVGANGGIQRARVASLDPSKAWVCDLLQKVRIDNIRPHPVWDVLETKTTFLAECLSPDMLASMFAPSEEVVRALRALEPKSLLAAPMVSRGKLVGSIALISTNAAHLYGPREARLAEALAGRAALSIENARLYRDAQRASKAREEVLAIVSHDLRNPLATIAIVSQRLKHVRPNEEEKIAKTASMIERSAEAMQTLIGDLLDFARIQGGALSIERHAERLGTLVREVVDMLTAQVSTKNLRLEVDIPPDLPDASCDKSRIAQVLSNLLGNAIKFTPAGGVLRLSARKLERELEISVCDTGPGIKPEDIPTIFERFWQARESRALGAGLGLSIAQGIVAAHGGKIWVESQVGVGSTFRFTLPVAHAETESRRL